MSIQFIFDIDFNRNIIINLIKIELKSRGIKGVEAKTRSKIKPKFKPLITCFSASSSSGTVGL